MKKTILFLTASAFAFFGASIASAEEVTVTATDSTGSTVEVKAEIKPVDVKAKREAIKADIEMKKAELKDKRVEVKTERMENRAEMKANASSTRADIKEKRGEIKEKRDDMKAQASSTRAEMKDRRDEMKANASSTRADIKEKRDERKANASSTRAEMKENASERIAKTVSTATEKLNGAISKLEELSVKIDTRLDKFEADGGDTTAPRAELVTAESKIAAAKTSISAIASIQISTTEPKTSAEAVRKAVGDSQKSIQEAKQALMKAVPAMKGIQSGIKRATTTEATQ